MKLEDTPKVGLCILICLLSRNAFVSTAPSSLGSVDGTQTLPDPEKNFMKADSIDSMAEYTENHYKDPLKERVNRAPTVADQEGETGEQRTQTKVNVPKKLFKRGSPLRNHSDNTGAWYDFALRASDGDIADDNEVIDKQGKVAQYINEGLRPLETKRLDGQGVTDTVLNLVPNKKDPKTEAKFGGKMQPSVNKRQYIICDVSRLTLNMLVEYFKNKTLCGKRTSQIRYGLGK